MAASSSHPAAQPLASQKQGGPAASDTLLALSILAFFCYLYLLTYNGLPHNPDAWVYLDGARTALTGQLSQVNIHGWLFSVLLAPLVGLSTVVPRLGSIQTAFLSNVVITASTAAVLYAVLGSFERGRALRLATALVFGLATLAWPYSHYLYREPLTALVVLLTMWTAVRFWQTARPAWLVAFAVACAASLLVKMTTVALLPFFGVPILVTILRQWATATASGRKAVGLLRPLVDHFKGWTAAGPGRKAVAAAVLLLMTLAPLVILLVVAQRLPLLQELVPTYQEYLRDRGPNFANFAALWISPGWGLLSFAPALWLAVLGAVPFTRRYPAVAVAALGGSLVYVLAATPHPFWWGNWSFGPRQMVPLIPLLCLPIPLGLRSLRTGLGPFGSVLGAGLVALSVGLQLVGLFVPFDSYVRQVLFPANITGPEVTWNLQRYPIAGMLRFASLQRLDVAWIFGRNTEAVQVLFPVALPLLLATGLTLAWLLFLSRSAPGTSRPRGALGSTLLALALWIPAAILSVQSVYLDERYEPELGFPAAAQAVRQEAGPRDVLITDLWTDNLTGPSLAMLNYCRGGCPKQIDQIRENLTDREPDWQTRVLADLADYRQAWLVLTRVAEGDPNSIVERWLGEIGFLAGCRWTGPQVRLCGYSLGPGRALPTSATQAQIGDDIRLAEARGWLSRHPASTASAAMAGDSLLVELVWKADGPIAGDYIVSLQLLGPDGSPVAATDRRPHNGLQPTNTWVAGERVVDRYSLSIPPAVEPGSYQLLVILYDPPTGQRLTVRTAAGQTGDTLTLLDLAVTPG